MGKNLAQRLARVVACALAVLVADEEEFAKGMSSCLLVKDFAAAVQRN